MIRTLSQILAGLPDNTLRLIAAVNSRDIAEGAFGALIAGPPSANDDNVNTAGNGFFDARSWWQDSTNGDLWYCESGTPTAASWVQVYPQASPPATVVTATLPVKSTFDGIHTYDVSLATFPPAAPAPAPGMVCWGKRNGPFWADLAKTIPATSPTDRVRVWQDSSGLGFDFTTDPVLLFGAILIPNAQAGFAAVQCDITGTSTQARLLATPSGGTPGVFTTVLAFKLNTSTGQQAININDSGGFYAEFRAGGGNLQAQSFFVVTDFVPSDTSWHTIMIEWNGATSTFSVDGSPPTPWVAQAGWGGVNYLALFQSGAFVPPGDVTIGEAIFYPGILSSADYALTASYMSAWLGTPVSPGVASIGAGTNVTLTGTPSNPVVNVPAMPAADVTPGTFPTGVFIAAAQVGVGYAYSDLSGAPPPVASDHGPLTGTSTNAWVTVYTLTVSQAIIGILRCYNTGILHHMQIRFRTTDAQGTTGYFSAFGAVSGAGLIWNFTGIGPLVTNQGSLFGFPPETFVEVQVQDDTAGLHTTWQVDFGLISF